MYHPCLTETTHKIEFIERTNFERLIPLLNEKNFNYEIRMSETVDKSDISNALT